MNQNQNGDLPDQTEVVAGDERTLDMQVDGSEGERQNGRIPAQQDYLLTDKPTTHSMANLLFEYPSALGDFITRTNVVEGEIDDIIGMRMLSMPLDDQGGGSVDYEALIWLKLGLRISVGGNGRKEFLRALGAEERRGGPTGQVGRMMDRLKRSSGSGMGNGQGQ